MFYLGIGKCGIGSCQGDDLFEGDDLRQHLSSAHDIDVESRQKVQRRQIMQKLQTIIICIVVLLITICTVVYFALPTTPKSNKHFKMIQPTEVSTGSIVMIRLKTGEAPKGLQIGFFDANTIEEMHGPVALTFHKICDIYSRVQCTFEAPLFFLQHMRFVTLYLACTVYPPPPTIANDVWGKVLGNRSVPYEFKQPGTFTACIKHATHIECIPIAAIDVLESTSFAVART